MSDGVLESDHEWEDRPEYGRASKTRRGTPTRILVLIVATSQLDSAPFDAETRELLTTCAAGTVALPSGGEFALGVAEIDYDILSRDEACDITRALHLVGLSVSRAASAKYAIAWLEYSILSANWIEPCEFSRFTAQATF